MKTRIYEYPGQLDGKNKFSSNFVRDYSGSGCWEIETEIPDKLNPYKTMSGEIAIEPKNGFRYLLSEILLTGNSGEPYIDYTDEDGNNHRYQLPVFSRTEKSTAMYL